MPGDFLGRGWKYPVRPDRSGSLPYEEGEEKIRQSIQLILATAPGERVMRPEFGCGIHALTFEANTTSLRASVAGRVRESLVRWEPRIDVLDVRVETPLDERNRLLIRIDYRVRANNAQNNLVYPFFLAEGIGPSGAA